MEKDPKEEKQRSPQKRLRFEDEEPERDSSSQSEEGYKESVVDRQLRELNEERRKHYLK